MNKNILQALAALASGTVFGFGLSLSGMLNPARVQGFLDIFGAWDPTLMFVLGGAVMVAMIGMYVTGKMKSPALADAFDLPETRRIDRKLVIGSAIFGLGWGFGGFCPGPAVASLALGLAPTLVFVVFMVIGMIVHDRFVDRSTP